MILDARAIPEIDVTAADELSVFFRHLRERGITVDIPQSRLELAEFYQRASRAWLVWSPEAELFHFESVSRGRDSTGERGRLLSPSR